jgi:FixJ family two-component response regulator
MIKSKPVTEPIVSVIDDDDTVRDGLISLFRSVGLQARGFGSVREFQQDKLRDAPGCLVLDVRLPGKSGLDLQAELGELEIHLPIVFISGHADVPMSVKAMKAGAVEFLSKPFREQELLDAVRTGIERDQEQRDKHKSQLELKARYESLTPREQQVFRLVAMGLMNKQVAGEMAISLITVKVHRGNVMQKMRAKSLADLVRMSDALGVKKTVLNNAIPRYSSP